MNWISKQKYRFQVTSKNSYFALLFFKELPFIISEGIQEIDFGKSPNLDTLPPLPSSIKYVNIIDCLNISEESKKNIERINAAALEEKFQVNIDIFGNELILTIEREIDDLEACISEIKLKFPNHAYTMNHLSNDISEEFLIDYGKYIDTINLSNPSAEQINILIKHCHSLQSLNLIIKEPYSYEDLEDLQDLESINYFNFHTDSSQASTGPQIILPLNVKSLDITAPFLTEIPFIMPSDIRDISLNNCKELRTLAQIPFTSTLNLNGCDKITDAMKLDFFKSFPSLELKDILNLIAGLQFEDPSLGIKMISDRFDSEVIKKI